MLTIDTTGNISWGQPDWERIYNSPNNTKSVDELIKECRSELTTLHLYDLQEKIRVGRLLKFSICKTHCQYRGLCCDKDCPNDMTCVKTMEKIILKNGHHNPEVVVFTNTEFTQRPDETETDKK